jgi:hypothetical protein
MHRLQKCCIMHHILWKTTSVTLKNTKKSNISKRFDLENYRCAAVA